MKIGGIAGRLAESGEISYSFNVGTIEVKAKNENGQGVAGGICGTSLLVSSALPISSCYNVGTVKGIGVGGGGIIGMAGAKVSAWYRFS